MALLVVVFPSYGIPQSKGALIGTWKLVSATDTIAKGDIIQNPFGQNPTGLLTYTADHRMMAIILMGNPGRSRSMTYAGRYAFAGDKMSHHVEAGSVQNWVNTDLVRIVKLQGNRLIIRTGARGFDWWGPNSR